MASAPLRVNLGGEGEVPGVLNQQGPWVLDPNWRSSRDGKTLGQLLAEGHQFVIASNTRLPFADGSVDEVITNWVPIDITTYLGPGIQAQEVRRILKAGGRWIHNGTMVFIQP